MSETIELTAGDGHSLGAYTAIGDNPRAGIVLLQEIFGVTDHIRAVCDRYAADGYAVVAPALFDRVRPGVRLDYTDIPTGKSLVEAIRPQETMLDIAAATDWARAYGKVGVVGFCWGGTLAYLAASALPIDAAVAYYGGMIAKFVDRRPRAPVLYHFGGRDPFITAADLATIQSTLSPDDFHVYADAGHGFNCNERSDFDAASAELAEQRTLAFLARLVG